MLVPLVEDPVTREPHALLTHRSYKLRSHRGEICFPGGKIDDGESIQEVCLQEFTNFTVNLGSTARGRGGGWHRSVGCCRMGHAETDLDEDADEPDQPGRRHRRLPSVGGLASAYYRSTNSLHGKNDLAGTTVGIPGSTGFPRKLRTLC